MWIYTLKMNQWLLILFVLIRFSYGQLIFDETCEYQVTINNKTEVLRFASQLIHITNKNYDVYINFCKPLKNMLPMTARNCNQESNVCVLKKRNKHNVLPGIVTYFQAQVEVDDDKKEKIVMKTNNLGVCQSNDNEPGENYEFTVIVGKDVTENSIQSTDPCAVEVKIPHPMVEVRDCSVSYNGIIIDLQALKSFPQQILTSNTNSPKTTYIAACRPAESCSNGAHICEISKNKKGNDVLFSVTNNQNVNYNAKSNLVTLRGKKVSGKYRGEVLLNCNWTAEFENPQKRLGNYMYSIDSKFGCVKTPLNCEIEDIDNYLYNLSSLNKPWGWPVQNVTKTMKNLKINVCGALINPLKTQCLNTSSQVCGQQNDNQYISYGGLHSGLSFDGEDIKLIYTHGSQCLHSGQKESLSTHITFKCCAKELGPRLTDIINCTTYIVWNTPQACAKTLSKVASFSYTHVLKDVRSTPELDCSVYHNRQMFRLGSLISNSFISFNSGIKPNLKYYVNICKPIAINTTNYYCGVTGACVDEGDEINLKKRYKSMGSFTKASKPKFENDELIIRYEGGFCEMSMQREFIIHFNCSDKQESLKVTNETTCHVHFTWNTPLACKRKVMQRDVNCQITAPDGKILNFQQMKMHNFNINYQNIIYDVDLCSDIIDISSNLTTVTPNLDLLNATRRLIRNECNYSMIYNLTNGNDCDDKLNLSHIKVDLLCDEIENNNDHFGEYAFNGCEGSITLKSQHICSFVHCSKAKETPQQEKTKDVYHIDSETSSEVTTAAPSVCKVVNDNEQFVINRMTQLKITKDKHNYTIGYNDKAINSCKGFVCRNNITLGTLDICPNVRIVEDDGKAELNLIGPSCSNDFYRVKLVLHCEDVKVDQQLIDILSIKDCSTEILIRTNEICGLFAKYANVNLPSANSDNSQGVTFTIIGILICLIIILGCLIVIWRYKLCHCKLPIYDRNFGETDGTPTRAGLLYIKDLSD